MTSPAIGSPVSICVGFRGSASPPIEASLTMRNGATIQFTNMLETICFHMYRCAKSSCKASNRTLHKMGYIMMSRPTANHADDGVFSIPVSPAYIGSVISELLTNRNGYTDKLPFLQSWAGLGHKIAQENAHQHGEEYPDGEVAVQEAK